MAKASLAAAASKPGQQKLGGFFTKSPKKSSPKKLQEEHGDEPEAVVEEPAVEETPSASGHAKAKVAAPDRPAAVISQPDRQKLGAFFPKSPKKSNRELQEDGDETEGAINEEDEEEDEPITKVRVKPKGAAPDASNLPPIHDIPAIFADLVSHIPDIKPVAERIAGRKLRVATMCSGTESPLLALELIQKSILEQYDVNLEVEHVFSCEIEPFKQAYIERNFRPPILFRDVCELGNEEATTAYGALVPVPGNVDLLVAGTSCVDYSNLNNEKQDLDANGESGRTFRGMMSWVRNHQPPLVILENVCSAPWERVVNYFEKNNYSAKFVRVDTKQYYIPHTRTRVYLLAVNKAHSSMPKKWAELVSTLKRPASSTLDAFLLPSDDPRIHQSRQKLVQEGYNALDRRTGRTDWGRCESRHQRARLEEALGSKRPLTGWDEGGYCKLPDFAWNDWGVGQVERVWDLMDITLLRSAKDGADPSFKTQVWNLSQNVDRTIGASKAGICPCLTPSMIPYISNRGGPMVGLEALSMQGLPVDKLLLTRETEDQLADLAGNAMSTTVVGACILAALVTGKGLLKEGDDTESYEKKHNKAEAIGDTADGMDIDKPDDSSNVEDHIVGENELIQRPLDLASASEQSLSELLLQAQRSSRLCECEGRKNITEREIHRCIDCGASACKKCAGRPEHNMEVADFSTNPRLTPAAFESQLKSMLPMCLNINNVTQALLDDLKSSAKISTPSKSWIAWRSAVLKACKHELRFVEPKRQDFWSAVYRSPTATLELLLHPQQPEWRVYAKPDDSEPANSELRRLLAVPFARFTCVDGLFKGKWEFAFPEESNFVVTMEGVGDLTPSWEAKLGLLGDDYREKQVHSQLKMTVSADALKLLDRDISGVYTLFDKCGTANSALHKKQPTSDEDGLASLFFLLDPSRCGAASEDSFVFTTSKQRFEYGESRPIICKLDYTWRQSDADGAHTVNCTIPYRWVESRAVAFQASQRQHASFSVPGDTLNVSLSTDTCYAASALLTCEVDLLSQSGAEWPQAEWREVDKVHERQTFRELSFLTERIRDINSKFNSWQTAELSNQCQCPRCAPSAPTLKWARVGKKIIPLEDTIEAGSYERRLKSRPPPFVTQLRVDDSGIGHVRIGVNIASLIHRAVARLPSTGRSEPVTVAWRLDTEFTPMAKLNPTKFLLRSNKLDAEHAQPPNFKTPLRKEQLRSLQWMLAQEARDAPAFIEEEISEAILEPLGWRAEGRAQRKVHVRGGVLADEVGYGKTAITLGLIDCAANSVKKEFAKLPEMNEKVAVKATLVIVPPHLTKQWSSEVKKFTGNRFKVVVLSTATNLNTLTIDDVQQADLIIVASNLFHGTAYQANLEAFAAGGTLPTQDGRYFNARLDAALECLGKQVERLKSEGSEAVLQEIHAARKRSEEEEAQAYAPTKRLKGKSYRDAADAQPKPAPNGAVNHQTRDSQPGTQAKPRTKMVPEVVIPMRRARGANNAHSSSSAPSSPQNALDSDDPQPRKRRAAAKRVSIIISDDEDDDEAPVEASSDYEDNSSDHNAGAKRASASKRLTKRIQKRKTPPSSDYEDSDSAEETPDDASGDESDDDPPVSKSSAKAKQPKAKAPAKSKGSSKKASASSSGASATSDTDDTMDVDGQLSAKGKSAKKRKAADSESERPAKKQKRREETDPWKLKSAVVKSDWTEMKSPPLEMFHFARKVVDEYTYLDGKDYAMINKISADRHWVLSGTPPTHDFAAVKTIAAFLHLHLGVDDDREGQSQQVKKRRRDQTAVEKFHSFREVHTWEWHAHRDEIGQAFLDRFVRQNIAEIDEIPWTDKIQEIILPAAERAIYLELEHHLRALDMTIKRGKKTESDREKRLAQSLGESSTAEEALLKRCSHFDLDTSDKENAMKACEVIVQERTKQLAECEAELLKALKQASKKEKDIGKTSDESMFVEYVRVSYFEGVGDTDAGEKIRKLLDDANAPKPLANNPNKLNDGKPAKPKAKSKDEVKLDNKKKDQIWEHREHTHVIRRLTKELVGRVRSLRYFTVVRDLQKLQATNKNPEDTITDHTCPRCSKETLRISEVAVLSSCGHLGCYNCVKECAEKEECIFAETTDKRTACNAAARVLNIVRGETLGADDARDGRGRHFGKKLEEVMSLIKNKQSSEERVLIFVQFPDLMKKVSEALTAQKIKFLEIRGSASQKSKNLEKFQNLGEERVLLLNVVDESASGANLTCANHAVFLSPLLTPTQEGYDARMTQAVGRLVRFGQTQHVHIWRFLSKNTIDEEIWAQRNRGIKSRTAAITPIIEEDAMEM